MFIVGTIFFFKSLTEFNARRKKISYFKNPLILLFSFKENICMLKCTTTLYWQLRIRHRFFWWNIIIFWFSNAFFSRSADHHIFFSSAFDGNHSTYFCICYRFLKSEWYDIYIRLYRWILLYYIIGSNKF